MINLEDITVYNDLRARLAEMTPQKIAASARRFKPPGKKDTIIGVIESQATRGLYALWMNLEVERDLETAQARGSADADGEKEHFERAAALDMFSEVAKEMFWAQAKIDLGYYETESVGLRTGWQLIRPARERMSGILSSLGLESE